MNKLIVNNISLSNLIKINHECLRPIDKIDYSPDHPTMVTMFILMFINQIDDMCFFQNGILNIFSQLFFIQIEKGVGNPFYPYGR